MAPSPRTNLKARKVKRWAPGLLGFVAIGVWFSLYITNYPRMRRLNAPPFQWQAAGFSVSPHPAPAPLHRGAFLPSTTPGSLPSRAVQSLAAARVGTGGTSDAVSKIPPAAEAPLPTPETPTALSGSILLGGPLGLESLFEKAMVPAARIEKALRTASADPLHGLPRHWRAVMQELLQGKGVPLQAEVVRLPMPKFKQTEEFPLALTRRSPTEIIVPLSSSAAHQAVARWVERHQRSVPEGKVKPVLLILEPLEPLYPVISTPIETAQPFPEVKADLPPAQAYRRELPK